MSLEARCYAILSSAAGVVALVGSRVYLQQRLVGTPLPAVTYSVDQTQPVRVLAGGSGLSQAEVTITSTAETYASALAIADAVEAAFAGSHAAGSGIVIEASRLESRSPQDAGFDAGDETEPTRVESQFIVHYRSA